MDADSSFNDSVDQHDIESEKRRVKSRGADAKLELVTKTLKDNFNLDGSALVYEDSEEEVVSGQVTGGPAGNKVLADNPLAIMPDFDALNENDGDKAQELARSIKVDFDPNDVRYWFSELEGEMTMATVKSQWLKRTVLQRNLPKKQKEDVKALLTLSQTEAGNDIY